MKNEFDANQSLTPRGESSWMQPAPARAKPVISLRADVATVITVILGLCSVVAYASAILGGLS